MRTIIIRLAVGALSLVALLSGAAPAGAAARTHNSPPGNSAINQYIESVPTAGGGKPSRGITPPRGRRSRGSGSGLSPSTARVMSNSGPAGQQAAAFASATAPSTTSQGQGQAGSSTSPGQGQAASGTSGGGSTSGGSRRSGALGSAGAELPKRFARNGGSGGSSPVSGVLSAFVGSSSSSGGLGPWLPVLMIVILSGGCAVGLRHLHRRKST